MRDIPYFPLLVLAICLSYIFYDAWKTDKIMKPDDANEECTYLMRRNNCGKEIYIKDHCVNPALNWHTCENGEEGILLPVRKEYIK